MSLFQCGKCGGIENTALTECSHAVPLLNKTFEECPDHKALLSYKEILGISPDEEFERYCSECCPVWYDKDGNYGIGPNPSPKPEEGQWHGCFGKRYLPLGRFDTNPNTGNILYKGDNKDCEVIGEIITKEPWTKEETERFDTLIRWAASLNRRNYGKRNKKSSR